MALLAVALLPGACGGSASPGPGVAAVASTAAATPPASRLEEGRPDRVLEVHARARRIKDFPDPDGDGELSITAGPGSDLDPNDPVFEGSAAAPASRCWDAESPEPGAAGPERGREAEIRAVHALARHHRFPGPRIRRRHEHQRRPGSDLDPDSPQFKSRRQGVQALACPAAARARAARCTSGGGQK